MTGYAVRLLRIDSRPTPRLTESPFATLFIGPVNSLPQRLAIVLRTRTIKFKGVHFSRRIISYGSWVIRLHERGSFQTFRLIRINLNTLYRKGNQIILWGIGYFVTPARIASDMRYRPTDGGLGEVTEWAI